MVRLTFTRACYHNAVTLPTPSLLAGQHYQLFIGNSAARLVQLIDEDDWRTEFQLRQMGSSKKLWPKGLKLLRPFGPTA